MGMGMKSKNTRLVIWAVVCIIFIFVAALVVLSYVRKQGGAHTSPNIQTPSNTHYFTSPPVEEFKLYKFCYLYDKVKNLQRSIYNSPTISTDDNRALNDMCSFIDNKLSAIQHSSCGKYVCTDDISDEYKIAECTQIDGGDVSEILQKLNEMKMYIKKLSVADEQNYTRRIEKIVILLQDIEKP
jgi:hypothetical protein